MSKRVNRDDIDKLHDYGLYLPTRTITMFSETADADGETGTDSKMAEKTIKNLHVLDTQSDAPITILMNNIGGDEIHGMAIYDAIAACRSIVTIKVLGHAMSMGSIILQAADEGERILSPNAKVMIHYGTPLHVDSNLHALEQQMWLKECNKFRIQMENLYLERIREKHPEYTLARVKKLLSYGTTLDAREAVAYGLADKIQGEGDDS